MPQRLPDDVAAAPDSARIRVGIRLPGEVVPAYLATALGRVLAVARERIEIVAVVVQPRRLDSPSSADRLYEALDGLIYGRGIDPLTPTRAPAGLRSVIRRGHVPEADPTHPFDGADVILDLVGEPYSGPVPPFGRWHLVFTAGLHGAPERALRSAGADGLGMAALVADLDDRSVAIEQIVGALPSAGFGRSRAALYWGSASFMARALERLASSRSVEGARSGAALDGSTMIADSAGGQHRSRSPGGRRWAELATVTARRSFERAVYREGWTVLYRRRDAWDAFAPPRDLRGFRRVPAPVDRFFADPFVVAEDGRHCLYVEESAAGQHAGVISQLELDGDRWSAPETILSTGRHLSYPHVTRVDGRLVMVVDESASGAVTVYEREDVGWRPGPVLVDGIRASDPTLFEHGGRLWLL
ncbi:MAG TPA: hypothetical protein VFI28_13830, partial [Candidatus Limnocylindrales bacterium]|nr:hypothetical protein [Candidatus Limnocylindrales bacterium]